MDIPELLISSFQRAPWGWGVLVTMIYGLIKIAPQWKRLAIGEHARMRQEYIDQIKALREEIDRLRERVDGLTAENTDLKLQIAGLSRQHIAEQAAAIRNVPAVREAVEDVVKETNRGKA